MDLLTGTVFVDGLRNEVAMEIAPDGVLWGAGNSADNLERDDLGGKITNDNPAEEVHRLLEGQNYGYPYCWREYDLNGAGLGRGTAWAWPTFMDAITDEQCRDDYNQPVLTMQAHSAPLGITFYRYTDARPAECDGILPFPQSMDENAFVAFHGSWNRDTPTGYKVVYFALTPDGTGVQGGIGADLTDLLAHDGDSAPWSDGLRPVDVSFDACGRLLVSSDGTKDDNDNVRGSQIIRIETMASSEAPITVAPVSNSPITVPPSIKVPVTDAPTSDAFLNDAPVGNFSMTETLVSMVPVSEESTTITPATKAPVNIVPESKVPESEAPISESSKRQQSSFWPSVMCIAAFYFFFW